MLFNDNMCCLLVLNSVTSKPQWIRQPNRMMWTSSLKGALSEERVEASSSDSGGGGSQRDYSRARSSVVCGWSRGVEKSEFPVDLGAERVSEARGCRTIYGLHLRVRLAAGSIHISGAGSRFWLGVPRNAGAWRYTESRLAL